MGKTVLTPYYEASEKSIIRLLKQPNKIFYKRFYSNLEITLQKLGANAFTKTVRMLLDKEKIYAGFSSTAVKGSHVPVYSLYIGDQHLLAGIVADIVRCSPDSADDVIEELKKLDALLKEIYALQKRIDDASIEKLNQLRDQSDQVQEMISSLLDYPRIAEAVYFSFIRYIAAEIDRGSSIKLFELANELFKKMIMITFKDILDMHDQKLFDATLEYIFTVSFTTLTPREVLINIEKRFGHEIADTMRQANFINIKSIENITQALAVLKFINISPLTFNNMLAKRFGQDVVSILYGHYDYFIAWATVTSHHPILFNMGPVDRQLQADIEMIILNYKSKVRI